MDIVREITTKIGQLALNVEFLEASEYEKLTAEVCRKFSNREQYTYPLWEHLIPSLSVHDSEGWKRIGDFVGNNKAYLFLEKAEANFACLFRNGWDIVKLLSECFAFVFYVTNDTVDFLICFNDHDFLIEAGTIKKQIND